METGQQNAGKRIIANSGWLFFDKIIRQGLNLLLTAYIARYLGAEIFGEWNYAIAFVVLFSFLSTFGLYNILLRDFVKQASAVGEIIGSALAIRFFGACLTLLLSVGIITLFKPEANTLHLLVFVTALNYVGQTGDVIDYYFQSQLRSNWIAIARGISFILFGAIKVYLVQYEYPVIYFAVVQAAEFFLSDFIMIQLLGKIVPYDAIKVNMKIVRQLVRDSAPILFAEIAILVYMRTDQIMIGELIGERALGNYSAAVKLSEVWYFIPGIICSSVFPSIIKDHADHPQRYHEKLQKLYDLLSGISITLAVGVSVTSYWIIFLLFGPDYSAASDVLTIHVWTGVFVFWGLASNQQLVIEQRMNISLYRTITGMLMNIALNFLLIPLWGIRGAAVATLIAQASSAWISNLLFKGARQIFWMNLRSLNPARFLTLAQSLLTKGFK